MKTTAKKSPAFPAFLLAVFFLLPLFSAAAFAGTEPVPPQRFFVGAAAGYFYPGQSSFRKIYAGPVFPVELQLGWNLNRKMAVFAAARYLETSGKTVLLEAQRPEETYALRWRLATVRLGLNYWLWPSRFTPFLGAGISANFYKEQWLDVALVTAGTATGFFVQAGGRYRLGRRWHVLAQLEYSSVPAAGDGLDPRPDLGGLNLSLGLMAGIF
ncbi:MAG: porin family protein [Candidatus Aminicenantes bacterium]|nr:porin family protein [Candidatus Aminicenantes bacterium]